MSGKYLLLYSLSVKLMVILFVVALIWTHHLISQRWFDPIATTEDKITAVNAAGANVDERVRGITGLMDAVGHANVDLVKAFLARGARVDLHSLPYKNDRNEYTPLHMCLVFWSQNQQKQAQARLNQYEVLNILLETARQKNIDIVNAKDSRGNTSIHMLLFIPNDVTRSADPANTYVRSTVPGDTTRAAILRLLLKYGANINAQNNLGDTLLHNTVRNNDRPWAKKLLTDPQFKKLIDPSITNKEGLNPKDLAKKTFLWDMMSLICKHSSKESKCTYKEMTEHMNGLND